MEHLQNLSKELVELSRSASQWVVRVNGRRGPNASGILWSDNLVVTSHRACHRDNEIEIGLPDSRVVTGAIKGRAPDYDLATIELHERVESFQPIPWAEPGIPGLVVALARSRKGSMLTKLGLIATDELVHRIAPAPEFLGSSLVDSQGQFLGIHLMMGHPRVVARAELEEMLVRLSEAGHLEPAFLGLGLHRVETPDGYRCLVVKAEGPARQAGILIGDRLLSVADVDIEDPKQVREVVRGLAAGSPVKLSIWRAEKELELEVTLGTRPETCLPGKVKKHIKRVIRHLHHHHGPPRHHHGPRHHHHGPPPPPPPPPPEEPELC
jgi:serine protease Do